MHILKNFMDPDSMNQTTTSSKTKTKVITGLIIAGVIMLAAGAGWIITLKVNKVPVAQYNTVTKNLSSPVVDTAADVAKEIIGGTDTYLESNLDSTNTNTNDNTNSNSNSNSNTNTNTGTGSDDVKRDSKK